MAPPETRDSFISRACQGDSQIEADVRRLLAEYAAADDFLSTPALGDIAGIDPPPPRFSSGTMLAGRFRIVRFNASGGMGEVYEGEDLELGEPTAIKTVRRSIAASERALELFKKEIQLARRVTHPNVCRIFDFFQHREDSGEITNFLSMELLAGRIFRPHDPVWLLVAALDNHTGDSLLDDSIPFLLERDIANSSGVYVAPRGRVEDALRLMRKDPKSRVDEVLGREVCLRDGGIRLVASPRGGLLNPRTHEVTACYCQLYPVQKLSSLS